eukprot:TRINITY_DN30554_c0_g1_i1.p1 TRINITY_DN30554_c0_g1~~TRINITY_DN30554_c0_g1_i1.p1  ORF type:complete len:381 (+),score=20.70 TRINITY_DN30554_c0_g1_i1:82-1224(+)
MLASSTSTGTFADLALSNLQGTWLDVTRHGVSYNVCNRTVTKVKESTGEIVVFNNILVPSATGQELRWGNKGNFILQLKDNCNAVDQLLWIPTSKDSNQHGIKPTPWYWRRPTGPSTLECRVTSDPITLQNNVSVEAPSSLSFESTSQQAMPVVIPPRVNPWSQAAARDGSTHLVDKTCTLAALQGVWSNGRQPGETYTVSGLAVVRSHVSLGSKCFNLSWNDTLNRLEWGVGGYVLEPMTSLLADEVAWIAWDGSERRFVWRRCTSLPDVAAGCNGMNHFNDTAGACASMGLVRLPRPPARLPRPPSQPPPTALLPPEKQLERLQLQHAQEQEQFQWQLLQHQAALHAHLTQHQAHPQIAQPTTQVGGTDGVKVRYSPY